MRSGTLHSASWLTTDRQGGVSQGAFASNNLAEYVGDDPAAVRSNRAQVARDLHAEHIVFIRATHSDQVALVADPDQDVTGADALITDRAGIALAALGADCAMIGMASDDGWIAVVHSGWRGIADEVVPNTVRTLAEHGCDVTTLRAHIGPSICADCYPVDAERAAQVQAVVPAAVSHKDGTWSVDVRAGVLAQLQDAGIDVTWDPRCTAEDQDLFSYRRDGLTGRQSLALVSTP